MKTALVTGGSGFFGGILKRRLLDEGWACVNVDLHRDDTVHPRLRSVQGDLRDIAFVERVFEHTQIDAIFHCAAMLGHAVESKRLLWTSNVSGTRVLAERAVSHGVSSFVFISTNCLWGRPVGRPVEEGDPPDPVEIYGRSKLEAELLLSDYTDHMDVVTLRSPTIVDSGRLGLLAILFEFIADGKRVWTVGDGGNRYQFIYAPDLADACIRASGYGTSAIFNVGSDDVPTLRESYDFVISRAGTEARVSSLPRRSTTLGMRLADCLRISPLGPYHYRMISEDFVFDTSKVKAELSWKPTLNNSEMLWEAYEYYIAQREGLRARCDVSAHRQAASMGVIRLLKAIS